MAISAGIDVFLIFGVLFTFFYYLYQKWKLESRYSIDSVHLHVMEFTSFNICSNFLTFKYMSKAYVGGNSTVHVLNE